LVQIINSGNPTFYGEVVVKKDSGIASMKDLKGKTFAFGDRDSTLTHILPLYMLMEAGVNLEDLKKYSFVGSHDNVALSVASGSFDAGELMPDIAAKYMDRGLMVMAKSPELPEHVFVATKKTDKAAVAKLQNALLAMEPTLYKAIKPTLTGLQKFDDKDFDILRKILKKVEKEVTK
jgi:phosphonate transport system substrate-binding protein